jgi:hypothetical protein
MTAAIIVETPELVTVRLGDIEVTFTAEEFQSIKDTAAFEGMEVGAWLAKTVVAYSWKTMRKIASRSGVA